MTSVSMQLSELLGKAGADDIVRDMIAIVTINASPERKSGPQAAFPLRSKRAQAKASASTLRSQPSAYSTSSLR